MVQEREKSDREVGTARYRRRKSQMEDGVGTKVRQSKAESQTDLIEAKASRSAKANAG